MSAIFIILFFSLVVLSLLFVWLKTILEIADAEMEDTSYKIVWVLFVFFMPVVGVCCWYVFGKKHTWERRREYV